MGEDVPVRYKYSICQLLAQELPVGDIVGVMVEAPEPLGVTVGADDVGVPVGIEVGILVGTDVGVPVGDLVGDALNNGMK